MHFDPRCCGLSFAVVKITTSPATSIDLDRCRLDRRGREGVGEPGLGLLTALVMLEAVRQGDL